MTETPNYRAIASEIRDISARIGVAVNPAWIREQLDELANRLELWGRPTAIRPSDILANLVPISLRD